MDARKSHISEGVVRKAQEEARHDKRQALHTLHHYFMTRRDGTQFQWHSIEEHLVRYHAKLCIELKDTDKVHDALQQTFIRLKQQAGTFRLAGLIDIYIGEAEAHLNFVRAEIESKPSSPASAAGSVDPRFALAAAVASMTGHDVQTALRSHAEEVAYRLYVDVVIACLRVTQKCNNLGVFSLNKITQALNQVAKGRRVVNVISLCKKVRDFTDPIKNRDKVFPERHAAARGEDERPKIWRDRGDEFLHSSSAMTQVIATLRCQLSVSADVGAWGEVLAAINEYRALLNIFRGDLSRNLPADNEIVAFYVELKSVLFKSRRFPFVAHVAIQLARSVWALQSSQSLPEGLTAEHAATEAVLAVLSVADVRTTPLAVAHDHEREKSNNLAASLDLAAPPNRNTLIAEILKPSSSGLSVLDMASENARALFGVLTTDHSVSVCQRAAPLLEALDSSFAGYFPSIRDCAVRALLPVAAKCFSSVSIARFVTMAAFFKPLEFRSRLEPIVVEVASDPNSNVSVQIDEAETCIRFRPVASLGDRAGGVQAEFSQRLAAAAAPCYRPLPAQPAMPFSFHDFKMRLEQEAHHATMRSVLCRDREDFRNERLEKAKRDIIQAKNDTMNKLREKAIEANEERKRRQIKHLKEEVAKEVTIERRKWVVKQLKDRHKGIDFPATIATDGDFLETVVRIVKEFNSKVEGAKDSDAKRMDYWERAAREVEIPKREQYEKDLALDNERLAAERSANRLRMHREEWERGLKMKESLAKFETHRVKHEREIEKVRSTITGGGKRDMEQSDLQKAMLERQRIAEEEAAKAAKAAPARAEPAPAPAAPAAPAAEGKKWAPKSRQ